MTGLFADAQTHNVRVVEREITLREIRDAVYSRGELAVVLVDKRMLLCEYCSTPAKVKLACHAASPSPAGFLGHYVLVSRFHAETDVFLVKDSSSRCSTCVVRGSVLEKARTAFGTDHDTIIVRGCWR